MKIEYVIQKILKKIFNRPCIKESKIDSTVRIDVRAVISNSMLRKYSYMGEHSSMIHTKVGAFACVSNYCAIGRRTQAAVLSRKNRNNEVRTVFGCRDWK